MGTKFCFYHPYHPETWQAMIDCGLVREGDGIRFCQCIRSRGPLEFNVLAAKGTELYEYIKRTRAPLYVDRLQGGGYIQTYPYDKELIAQYEDMLGDKFKGWQMHEWLSNYRTDLSRLQSIGDKNWNAAEIERVIREKFPGEFLYIESMTAEEMACHGNPKTLKEFRQNMFDVYKDRVRKTNGKLIPCDSIFLAYEFEYKQGAQIVMPEVGGQSADARMQISYARGEAKAFGREFGVYYEPWTNFPTTACCYQRDGRNEWELKIGGNDPYRPTGENGVRLFE